MRDFQHSVNVLVKAYLNDTLAHAVCTGCAVGNLIASELNLTIKEDETNNIAGIECWFWKDGTRTSWYDALEIFRNGRGNKPREAEGLRQIEATGYSIEEIDKIERAFESVDGSRDKPMWGKDDEYMLRGLMAVVDVLADIHGIDLTTKEQAKALFVKV